MVSHTFLKTKEKFSSFLRREVWAGLSLSADVSQGLLMGLTSVSWPGSPPWWRRLANGPIFSVPSCVLTPSSGSQRGSAQNVAAASAVWY